MKTKKMNVRMTARMQKEGAYFRAFIAVTSRYGLNVNLVRGKEFFGGSIFTFVETVKNLKIEVEVRNAFAS